jgi:ferritin-like metal-binding protein YciE
MPQANLNNLFYDGLRDILYAEKKGLQSYRKVMRAVQSEELKAAIEKHREETEGQVERLNRIFEIIGKRARSKPCHAMDGMVEEAEEVMEEYKGSPALDAGLLAAAQSMEHYEIARYGTLVSWARQLGHEEAEQLLRETLEEEKRTDELMTQLAETALNQMAEEAEGEDDDEQAAAKPKGKAKA